MSEVFEKENEIKEAFHLIGQEQVFRYWGDLNLIERRHLLKSLSKNINQGMPKSLE